MLVTLKDGWPAQRIAATGQTCDPGGVVEVDDDLGKSLCEQVDKWAEAKKPKKTSEGNDTEGTD